MLQLPEQIQKIVSLLPAVSRRDVLTFSIFVLVSTFFWIGRSAYEQNDATYEVSLRIENLPDGVVFTTQVPSTIKVTLYDNNMHLLNYGKNSSFMTLSVDFDRYADIAGNFRISGAELQSLLLNELSSSTQITAMYPSLVDARYAYTEGKRIAVKLVTDITSADDCRDFAPVLLTDSVLVHAPGYISDTLSYIQTETLKAENLKDTLLTKVAIKLRVGIKASPDSAEVMIPVVHYVEKRFDNLEIQATGVPEGKKLILFPRQANVRCLANFDRYYQFAEDGIRLTVPYDSLRRNPNRRTLPVMVRTKWSETDVCCIDFDPREVEFSVEE